MRATVALAWLGIAAAQAASPYALVVSSLGDGAPGAQGGPYRADPAVGGGGRTGAQAADAASGYAGLLTDPVALAAAPAEPSVPEGAQNALGAAALMDDGTLTALEPDWVAWSVQGGPLTGIDADGLAWAGAVRAPALAEFGAAWGGFDAGGAFWVEDSDPDNFGPVAGDGLPDGWQFDHFDTDADGALDASELAAANPGADGDGDGQSNAFEWLAGYDPGDALSRFEVELLGVDGRVATLRLSRVRPGVRYELRAAGLPGAAPGALIATLQPEAEADGVTVEAGWEDGGGERGFFWVDLSDPP